jgi:hypothetical protein
VTTTPRVTPTVMKTLRDFQRHTARHAFHRLFTTPDASPRFLVADEVGLGKTLVARGVIAQTIDHLRAQSDARIDIVYVASNAAIAHQNVRKLKIDGVEVQHRAGRLSLLPFRIDELDQREINVIALTPGTSLDLRGSNGVFRERAAVYRTLQSVWGRAFMNGMGAARTCFFGISEQHGSQYAKSRLVAQAEELGPLREPMRSQVRQMMGERDARRTADGRPTLREDFITLKKAYARGRRSWPRDISRRRQRFIRDMREILASAGVYALRPDLVILDEFQRFRDLIRLPEAHSVDRQPEPEGDPFAGQLAREIFDYRHEVEGRRTRVLMLSATPYAMHTTSEEVAAGSERHYEDFLETYRFLVDNDRAKVEGLKTKLKDLRSAIYDARYGGVEPAVKAAEAVSRQLLKVMSRTERLAVTEDREGMLTEVRALVSTPSPRTIGQYLAADAVSQHVGGSDPVDFWKSAAYPISFLGGMKYDITKRILAQLGPPRDPELERLLNDSAALLNWETVRAYGVLTVDNPRLELLWKQTVACGAWRLLWLPPSMPYYRASGDFETPSARRFTKRLIFSAWNVVPTSISTLTSYEVERLALATGSSSRRPARVAYDDKASTRNPTRLRPPDPTNMTVLPLIVPSHELAAITDPLAISRNLTARTGRMPTLRAVHHEATSRVRAAIAPIVKGRPRSSASDTTFWYWLIPALLDDRAGRPQPASDWWPKHQESDGMRHGLSLLREALTSLHASDLPAVPRDLEQVLARIGVASPATCALRAVQHTWPEAAPAVASRLATTIAWGLRSLFNGFEATRLIDQEEGAAYWAKVLAYCARGNLQSTLDEYLHVFAEWRGYSKLSGDLTEPISDLVSALSLRSAAYTVRTSERGQAPFQESSMRGRYAARFGDQKSEDGGEDRAKAVALAFNSPFWPFVLSSTSIGQEGLDFHLYCHAVTHWNLPANPVELEQREGRVHRYKGHAVRKNVGLAVPLPAEGNVWQEAFRTAENYRAVHDPEIVPYWVFQPDDVPAESLAKIERHIPIIPFTRESSRVRDLLASTAHYRIAFGQPRQDELLTYVLHDVPEEVKEQLKQVRVNLTPPVRHS